MIIKNLDKIDQNAIFKLYPSYSKIISPYLNYKGITYIGLYNNSEILTLPIARILKEIELNRKMTLNEVKLYLKLPSEECENILLIKNKEKISESDKKKLLSLYPEFTNIYGPYHMSNNDLWLYLYNNKSHETYNCKRITLNQAKEELKNNRLLTDNELSSIDNRVIVDIDDVKNKLLNLINFNELKKIYPEVTEYKKCHINISNCNVILYFNNNDKNIKLSLHKVMTECKLNKRININKLNIEERIILYKSKQCINNIYKVFINVDKDLKPYVLDNGQIANFTYFTNQLHFINQNVFFKLHPEIDRIYNIEIINGRPIILCKNNVTNIVKKISFIRAIVESNIGRRLTNNETVDHIDRDLLNNDPSNLSILTRSEHSSIDNIRIKIEPINCPICDKIFTPSIDQARNSKQNHAGPFCSGKCLGLFLKRKANNTLDKEISANTRNIIKTYYQLDKTNIGNSIKDTL